MPNWAGGSAPGGGAAGDEPEEVTEVPSTTPVPAGDATPAPVDDAPPAPAGQEETTPTGD